MMVGRINLHEAVRLHQNGRLEEAETIYRDILREDPNNADALYLLGTLYHQRGSSGQARLFLRRAITANPLHAEANNNLGLVYLQDGRFDESLACFEKAIAVHRQYSDAYFNLGNLHRQKGDREKAVQSFRSAVMIEPNHAAAWENLSITLRELDRYDEAIDAARRAIALCPNSLAGLIALGAAFKNKGELSEAARAFRQAVEFHPRSGIARSNLGITLAHLRDFASAEAECLAAVQSEPGLAVGWHNLGLVYFLQEKNEAASAFQQAIAINPKFPDACQNLGAALFRIGDYQAAIAAYNQALALQPSAVTYRNLGAALETTARWSEARDAFQRSAQLLNDDPFTFIRTTGVCPSVFENSLEIDDFRQRLESSLLGAIDRRPTLPFADLLDRDARPHFNLQFHGLCDRTLRELYARLLAPSFEHIPHPDKREGKPCVGFYVAPGHEYAFARSLGGLFPLFNQAEWSPVILSGRDAENKIRPHVGQETSIVELPLPCDQTIDAIRSLNLDLLYHWEIATSPLNYLLPFLRLAPIQVTSWGIQSTSGLPDVDYYLSSRLIESESAAEHYSEKLVLLATMLSFQPRTRDFEIAPSRRALGIPEDRHVYLCAQQIGKFHPDFDAILAGILEADPRAVILATASAFDDENRSLHERMIRTIPQHERICWIPKKVGRDYNQLIASADVVLDPHRFGGVNTTYDAFSAGKPVVTWSGQLNKNRFTFGCYQRMKWTDLVANSAENYIHLAVRLGTDPDFLAHATREIRDRRDILFECASSAAELETWMLETIAQGRR